MPLPIVSTSYVSLESKEVDGVLRWPSTRWSYVHYCFTINVLGPEEMGIPSIITFADEDVASMLNPHGDCKDYAVSFLKSKAKLSSNKPKKRSNENAN